MEAACVLRHEVRLWYAVFFNI